MNTNFEQKRDLYWCYTLAAEKFGENQIIEWAKEQYEQIKNDVAAMAAFVMVLNHKCWYWYDKGNEELSKIYSDLYYKYDYLEWNWLEAHGTEEEKHWYFKTLD